MSISITHILKDYEKFKTDKTVTQEVSKTPAKKKELPEGELAELTKNVDKYNVDEKLTQQIVDKFLSDMLQHTDYKKEYFIPYTEHLYREAKAKCSTKTK